MKTSYSETHPGNKLPDNISREVIAKFRNIYFVNGDTINWKGNKRPGWTEIKDDKSLDYLEGEIQEHLPLNKEFYVYFEFAKTLFLCSYEEIISYFENKPPWIEQDMYIFTNEMNWCLISTHDSEILLAQ